MAISNDMVVAALLECALRLRTEGHKRSVRWMVAQVLERIAMAEAGADAAGIEQPPLN
jgi:hypothetical protein